MCGSLICKSYLVTHLNLTTEFGEQLHKGNPFGPGFRTRGLQRVATTTIGKTTVAVCSRAATTWNWQQCRIHRGRTFTLAQLIFTNALSRPTPKLHVHKATGLILRTPLDATRLEDRLTSIPISTDWPSSSLVVNLRVTSRTTVASAALWMAIPACNTETAPRISLTV